MDSQGNIGANARVLHFSVKVSVRNGEDMEKYRERKLEEPSLLGDRIFSGDHLSKQMLDSMLTGNN